MRDLLLLMLSFVLFSCGTKDNSTSAGQSASVSTPYIGKSISQINGIYEYSYLLIVFDTDSAINSYEFSRSDNQNFNQFVISSSARIWSGHISRTEIDKMSHLNRRIDESPSMSNLAFELNGSYGGKSYLYIENIGSEFSQNDNPVTTLINFSDGRSVTSSF